MNELDLLLKKLARRNLAIQALMLIFFLCLAVGLNFMLKRQAAVQTLSFIKRPIKKGDFREAMDSLSDAHSSYFYAISYFNGDGAKVFSFPANLDPEFLEKQTIAQKLTYSFLREEIFFDGNGTNPYGTVLFVFNRFSYVPLALILWFITLISSVPFSRAARKRISQKYQQEILLKSQSSREEIASFVRHDLRSPLSALNIAVARMSETSNDNAQIIEKAAKRIQEILEELDDSKNPLNPNASGQLNLKTEALLPILEDIVLEKKIRFSGLPVKIYLQIPDALRSAHVIMRPKDFKRALSNIVDNAIEARDENSELRVLISVDINDGFYDVSIKDNGRGIDPKILPRISEKGFSIGKIGGSGLGLYFSRMVILKSKGMLDFKSQLGAGTTVTVSMPIAHPPSWYVEEIVIPSDGEVVLVDDQESSRESLNKRLIELTQDSSIFKVRMFSGAKSFLEWYSERANPSKQTLFLFDFDLKSDQTGLDLIKKLGLDEKSVLVTGHFDQADIQDQCRESKISLLPKHRLATVSFRLA